MTPTDLVPLAGLALVDSTSFGTLGIPVFLLARERVHVRAFLLFLATLAGFYWALGLLLLGGADMLTRTLAGVADLPVLGWAQLAAGVTLFALSWTVDGNATRRRTARRAASGVETGPTRRERWQAALVDDRPRARVVVAVALGAGLVEAASMLPYLAAVGIIAAAHPGPVTVAGVLLAYVLAMVAPALALLALRLVARRALDPLLRRLGTWLDRNADDILGWVLGIVGLLLAADAAQRLGLLQFG
ncbi:GAP family protein [Mobilicoccus pelagius]|uniref:Sap-like sulfolipid-1-addressing protein n=1 Tax=Mobilicoccus pelagius NBRC 104925 TaxID=1089455 RepID=H5UQ23_9MICO|nr:GAP family protein [Mobilicoccus pelagius]GAB47828.1 hypothetical protein MOPEL_029_01090 [Mobilicoccus pelagius NBRC 104925]